MHHPMESVKTTNTNAIICVREHTLPDYANTQCTPCGSGTFTSRNNHLPACLSCNGRRDRVTRLTIESVNALPDIIVFSKDHPDARHVFPKQNVE